MNKNVINKYSYSEMKAKHQKNKKWLNFARRCIKNKFVQKYLLRRDGGVCQYCGRRILGQFNIHHISYDHCCKSDDTIVQITPTPKRPGRHLHVPDCEQCSKDTPVLFNECMEMLCVVHCHCNMEIALEKNNGRKITL